MAPGAPLLLLLLLPPPLPSSPSAPPPAMDSYSGCCTVEYIRRRALNPSGCASRLERARSVERICSRISCGFRAVCSDWRSVAGSLSTCAISGFASSMLRICGLFIICPCSICSASGDSSIDETSGLFRSADSALGGGGPSVCAAAGRAAAPPGREASVQWRVAPSSTPASSKDPPSPSARPLKSSLRSSMLLTAAWQSATSALKPITGSVLSTS
mmetsp:Transcript_46042/g.152663  ORF Transcript_46042/g.152663 Transcript_46042/m.152663 type:complete len:215 (+) Transcript_46042:183-827(+)